MSDRIHSVDRALIDDDGTGSTSRRRALLNVADISPDSDPQEVRNREIERERIWFEKETEIERLTADNTHLQSQLDDMIAAVITWQDAHARMKEQNAAQSQEIERLQQIINTITSWPEMESYRQAISGLLETTP